MPHRIAAALTAIQAVTPFLGRNSKPKEVIQGANELSKIGNLLNAAAGTAALGAFAMADLDTLFAYWEKSPTFFILAAGIIQAPYIISALAKWKVQAEGNENSTSIPQ